MSPYNNYENKYKQNENKYKQYENKYKQDDYDSNCTHTSYVNKNKQNDCGNNHETYPFDITFIANSGSGDVIIGQNQDNDQSNKAETDESLRQIGAFNSGENSSSSQQDNLLGS